MFFHFVVKFNVLVDFCESCKKSGVISKVYAFDSSCFYCCAQSLKKVHQVFLFAMRFQQRRPYLIDVFLKVLRWQMMPIEAKFQSYVAFVARSRLQIPLLLRLLSLFKAITKGGTTRSSQKTHTIFRKTLSWSLLSHNSILHSKFM